MDIPAASTPIVCDMTDAPDTDIERLAEYKRLFTEALVGKEKTTEGIRYRFRAQPGIESWVRDLAAREQACCPFFAFDITTEGDEVVWDSTVSDSDMARTILDEFYLLPENLAVSMDDLRERLARRGLDVTFNVAGTVHHARPDAAASAHSPT